MIVPSRIESIPQVIKEAFFLKTPVIATDVGGNSELIKNRETGILVPSEDPDTLLSEINNLLENENFQEKYSKNALEIINNDFSWDALLPKYLDLYNLKL